jgi:hypothetical protein
MGADIELTKQFGSIDLREIVDRVRSEYNALIAKADPGFAKRAEQSSPSESRFGLSEVSDIQTGKSFQSSAFRGVGGGGSNFTGKYGSKSAGGEGIYVAPTFEGASQFGSTVKHLDVTLENPLVFRSDADLVEYLGRMGVKNPELHFLEPYLKAIKGASRKDSRRVSREDLQKRQQKAFDDINAHAREQGHDGIVIDLGGSQKAGNTVGETLSGRSTIHRRFGNDQIIVFDERLIQELGQVGKPAKLNKEAQKLQNSSDASVRDIQAIRDRIRGTYGIPEDPTTWTHRGIRVAKMWNAVSLLTGALAAVPDLAKLIMNDGFRRTIMPMMEAYHSNLGLMKTMKLAKNEANIAGEAFDMYLSMRSALFADLADSLSAATPFEKAAGEATQKFFNFAGMNQWNEMVKTMASLTTGSRIILESENLLKGKITKTEGIKLNNVGIDPETAKIIVEQTNKHGLVGEHTRIPKTEKWDKTPEVQAAADIYSRALGKDINRIIVTPGKGETPLFMSSPLHTLLFQFKTFAISATHRTLTPGLQLRDANFLQGNIGLLGLGALVNEIRRYQLDSKGEQSFGDWLNSSIERGGNMGVLSDLNSSLETLSDNRFGIRPMMGAANPYNTSLLSKGSAIGGPVVQQAGNLARVIWDIGPGDVDDRTINSGRRLLWGAKAFHTNGLYDFAEDGIASVIGD